MPDRETTRVLVIILLPHSSANHSLPPLASPAFFSLGLKPQLLFTNPPSLRQRQFDAGDFLAVADAVDQGQHS
jgi:hypothetical protein